MVSIAKITREDRNLTQDDERLWEEMTQVLELETDIANVSLDMEGKEICRWWKYKVNRDKLEIGKIKPQVKRFFLKLSLS